MPSETIYGTKTPFDVRVAWGQDCGYVQVASLNKDGAKALLGVVNGWLEGAGKPPIDWEEIAAATAGWHPSGHHSIGFDGWHATLDDRRSVNDLIHHLKRARDHAFGKDE